MSHDEFVQIVDEDSFLWGVSDFPRAVRVVWGTRGAAQLVLVSALIWLPALALAVYTVSLGAYGALAWLVLVAWGFLTGQPNVNCIDCAKWFICAVAGAIVAWFYGWPHLATALLAGVTWFLTSAAKGATMEAMKETLVKSAPAFERLRDQDLLILCSHAEGERI